MLTFVIGGLVGFMVLRFMVVLYADHQALDRLGRKIKAVAKVPLKERGELLKKIKERLNEITRASVWWRALDLMTWQANGWFEWMGEEEEK